MNVIGISPTHISINISIYKFTLSSMPESILKKELKKQLIEIIVHYDGWDDGYSELIEVDKLYFYNN